MKHLISVMLIAFVVHVSANGQDIPEPDFSKKPYYFQNGSLSPFEGQNAAIKKRVKAIGYGGAEYFYSVPGARSNVRFPAGAIPPFIIKLDDNSDPSEAIIISIGEAKKEERRFKAFKATMFNGNQDATQDRVKLVVKKIKDKVYEITIQGAAPGEYAILPYSNNALTLSVTSSVAANCFGIDQ